MGKGMWKMKEVEVVVGMEMNLVDEDGKLVQSSLGQCLSDGVL